MRITLKRLMLWVVMTAIATYLVLDPFTARNRLIDYAVAATIFAVVGRTAMGHPLGFFILGVILLNCLPLIDREATALHLATWGAYLGCFIGALAGWDAKSRKREAPVENEIAE